MNDKVKSLMRALGEAHEKYLSTVRILFKDPERTERLTDSQSRFATLVTDLENIQDEVKQEKEINDSIEMLKNASKHAVVDSMDPSQDPILGPNGTRGLCNDECLGQLFRAQHLVITCIANQSTKLPPPVAFALMECVGRIVGRTVKEMLSATDKTDEDVAVTKTNVHQFLSAATMALKTLGEMIEKGQLMAFAISIDDLNEMKNSKNKTMVN